MQRWVVVIAAGKPVVHKGFVNSAPVAHARLAFLGDIFSIPRSLPLANVFSIGDVILLVGAAAMPAGICGCPRLPASIASSPAPRPERRPSRARASRRSETASAGRG